MYLSLTLVKTGQMSSLIYVLDYLCNESIWGESLNVHLDITLNPGIT